MQTTIEAIIRNGQIVPTEQVELREGSRARVTIFEIDGEENDFWLAASDESLKSIWENDEDDIYAELLS